MKNFEILVEEIIKPASIKKVLKKELSNNLANAGIEFADEKKLTDEILKIAKKAKYNVFDINQDDIYYAILDSLEFGDDSLDGPAEEAAEWIMDDLKKEIGWSIY
jgi:hypothetical protein